MSEYTPYLLFLGGFLLILNLLIEKLKFGPLWLIFIVWYIPVLLSQNTQLFFNKQWSFTTLMATQCFTFGFLIGYLFTKYIIKSYIFNDQSASSNESYYRLKFTSYILSSVVIVSYTILFIEVGGPPLLSSDIGTDRMRLTQISPILFSIAQLSSAFASVYGYLLLKERIPRKLSAIWLIIFLVLILTAWRNLILTYLIFTYTPIFVKRPPTIFKIKIYLISFLILFSIIGFFRGDQGKYNIFSLSSALDLIQLYIYPSFINFEILQSFEVIEPHFYTLQFLFKPFYQILEWSTSPPQNALGAYNVATGMNPLYHDGGLINIFFVSFVMGTLLCILLKMKHKTIFVFFVISTIYATLFYMHNGWFLLNYMFSYNIITLFVLFIVYRILPKKYEKYI